MGMLEKHYDTLSGSPLDVNDLTIGHLVIDEHKANILTSCFSPDASAIGSASSDGEVAFFKISFPAQSQLAKVASSAVHESGDDVFKSMDKSEAEPRY
jgi:hypothetical protein